MIYSQKFTLTDLEVDCFGKLKLSTLLYYAQEVAGKHCVLLGADYDTLAAKNLFWAVIRHRVQITRLPLRGETITVETWPMPTTRVAYPRSMVAYDAEGNELFRSISLWVLMDTETRAMVLPGKSGIAVAGTLRGNELAAPNSLQPGKDGIGTERTVTYSCLDRNGHMNNTRYLDWVDDLLPSSFHMEHHAQEFVICYLSEAREGQTLRLNWNLSPEGCLQVDAQRRPESEGDLPTRVFATKLLFS